MPCSTIALVAPDRVIGVNESVALDGTKPAHRDGHRENTRLNCVHYHVGYRHLRGVEKDQITDVTVEPHLYGWRCNVGDKQHGVIQRQIIRRTGALDFAGQSDGVSGCRFSWRRLHIKLTCHQVRRTSPAYRPAAFNGFSGVQGALYRSGVIRPPSKPLARDGCRGVHAQLNLRWTHIGRDGPLELSSSHACSGNYERLAEIP